MLGKQLVAWSRVFLSCPDWPRIRYAWPQTLGNLANSALYMLGSHWSLTPWLNFLCLASQPRTLPSDKICLLKYPLCERSPGWCQGYFLTASPPSRILALHISSLCVPELASYFLAPWGVRCSAFRHTFYGVNLLRTGIISKEQKHGASFSDGDSSLRRHWSRLLQFETDYRLYQKQYPTRADLSYSLFRFMPTYPSPKYSRQLTMKHTSAKRTLKEDKKKKS